MFKHILLPTDGSDLSRMACERGIEIAKSLGARVTALHVAPEFHIFSVQPAMLEDTQKEYVERMRRQADGFLGEVASRAMAYAVPCETVYATDNDPYKVIVATAEKAGCDLILMASHGRRGMQALLLGSETQKVLMHSRIPVLVYR